MRICESHILWKRMNFDFTICRRKLNFKPFQCITAAQLWLFPCRRVEEILNAFVNRKRTKIVEWTLNAAMAAMTTTNTKENMQTDHIMWGTCTVLYIRQILSNPLCINKIVSSGICDSTIAAVDSKLQTQKTKKGKNECEFGLWFSNVI